jgi:hypothetical protein
LVSNFVLDAATQRGPDAAQCDTHGSVAEAQAFGDHRRRERFFVAQADHRRGTAFQFGETLAEEAGPLLEFFP